ncbi:MAG: FAD-dependent oxidoreductase, partial [Acidimicrobiales bacterium]
MTRLADPVQLGRATSRNRLLFGQHVTNLGYKRAISPRHVAYYARRAAGGAGVIVTEEASVDETDWPYERAPLAGQCFEGWQAVSTACHDEGALVIAAIGHAGSEGSSAYHQRALLGPSPIPDIATREVPKEMEDAEIAELIASFAAAGRLASEAGCDGVEVNAGQSSILRQFCSGLTNHREDGYGEDRTRLLKEVLDGVRHAVGTGIVGLRFYCDELAPWAGTVPTAAADMLVALVAGDSRFDYVTVVRGSAYGAGATRPDGHVPMGFNREATALVRSRLPRAVAVIAQGSIVDVGDADSLLEDGTADAVEMTRAQIAEPRLSHLVATGQPGRARPCVLCNQMCQVRDVRNPVVSCIGEPRSGHECEDADEAEAARSLGGGRPFSGRLVVVGGGPAGLECARVAARAGLAVTLLEREPSLGGVVLTAARIPGRERLAELTAWLESECRDAGVELVTSREATADDLSSHEGPVVCCTGSRPGDPAYVISEGSNLVSVTDVLSAEGPALVGDAPVVVWDPIGGPIGVGVAEHLCRSGTAGPVFLVTPDLIAGEQLARSGDLAAANVRLAQAGVTIL